MNALSSEARKRAALAISSGWATRSIAWPRASCLRSLSAPIIGVSMAPDRDRKKLARGQAIERVAQPEEMASVALFLASDESAFITGADLAADAGLSAGRAIPGFPQG